jgi:hypothetical protein
MHFEYQIQNGTAMPLRFHVQPAGSDTAATVGILPPSSERYRLINGTNPALNLCLQEDAVLVTLWSAENPEAPPKHFTMHARLHNYIVILCPTPFGEFCAPTNLMFQGRQLIRGQCENKLMV